MCRGARRTEQSLSEPWEVSGIATHRRCAASWTCIFAMAAGPICTSRSGKVAVQARSGRIFPSTDASHAGSQAAWQTMGTRHEAPQFAYLLRLAGHRSHRLRGRGAGHVWESPGWLRHETWRGVSRMSAMLLGPPPPGPDWHDSSNARSAPGRDCVQGLENDRVLPRQRHGPGP